MNPHLRSPRRRWPGRLVNLAIVVVVVALAAATFVLSYSGVHTIAIQAGVSTRLARVYPGLFAGLLVIACVAGVMLRDARWWARCYAWLVIILVMAAGGAVDAVHAGASGGLAIFRARKAGFASRKSCCAGSRSQPSLIPCAMCCSRK